MKNTPRWIRLAVSLFTPAVFASAVLSGCHSGLNNTPDKTITLEFWTLQLSDFKDTLTPMFQKYEQAHPGIKIKWVDVPFSEGEKRTLTALMAATFDNGNAAQTHVPDVLNLNPDFSAILASRHALLDMNQAVPVSQQKRYLPVAWQASSLSLPDQAVKSETTQLATHTLAFGLPWYITSSVTIYNQDILKKAGYTQPPSDVAQLEQFSKTVRAKTACYGLMPVVTHNGNFLKEIQKQGSTLYNSGGQAVFAEDPRSGAYLSLLKRLYLAGDIPAEALTESHQAAVDRYQSGTLALLLSGPNFLKIVKENAPTVFQHTAVAKQFPANAVLKDFALMLLAVPEKSAHPKEAVEFALFMTNAENQLALARAAPVLPSVTSALQSDYFNGCASVDLMNRARCLSAHQLLEARTAYQIQPRQSDINQIIDMQVQLALLDKKSPDAALKAAQQQINALIQE